MDRDEPMVMGDDLLSTTDPGSERGPGGRPGAGGLLPGPGRGERGHRHPLPVPTGAKPGLWRAVRRAGGR